MKTKRGAARARAAALLLTGATGCVSAAGLYHAAPPDLVADLDSITLNADIEVLGVGLAERCVASPVTAGALREAVEHARFSAIESVRGADNLMFVRLKGITRGGELCVKVSGRAYRWASAANAPKEVEDATLGR